ncbi:double-strand break repair protein AddB [Hartmannibacter diazotrophicus]|uniref:Double-strand break repair protein AddB n=1 Tax=Hartmannibacter diazotrophicus TaxID=1482074 RepID=A0A2C9D018_9HYPH|nr:double-strand break repair protein AddB [Hartmannibacter diazotrophicus]SON53573.1 double-strand break repair protein AddB [Hartmannibacter diazotrophicus]
MATTSEQDRDDEPLPPRVFSIDPAVPFLPTLVEALLAGDLVPGFVLADDPLALADVTILVPTRRAARVLRGEFVRALGGRAALLPVIRPIGDIDEEGDAFRADDDLDLPPVIGEAERLLSMARLVMRWREGIAPERELTPHGTPIRIPASPADAIHLARDLLALLDQAANEEIDWAKLSGLVPEDHAAYWQLTLTFLDIATKAWPEHLAERGLIEPGERHRQMVLRRIDQMTRAGGGPVIAAGSTGSIPTTAKLLAAIARLPNGAVVLPGLDTHLDDETFGLVAPEIGPGVPSHPQAALAHLVRVIGIERGEVRELGVPEPSLAMRGQIVSEALRPAETTDRWPAFAGDMPPKTRTDALDGLSIMVARQPAEEALAIALCLRETVEDSEKVAALVTADRELARRVCLELQRFGLAVEDSAGEALLDTPPAILARHVADVVLGGFAPDDLLALLKHPLASFGLPRVVAREAARAIEIAVLRGPRLAAGSRPLVEAIDRALADFEGKEARIHPVLRMLGPEAVREGRDLAQRVVEAFAPLEAMVGGHDLPLDDLLRAHVEVLRAVASDETGSDARLYTGPAGEELASFLAGQLETHARAFVIDAALYPAVFEALMVGRQVHRPVAAGARVHIWGQLEARLMQADRVVLGGLVEGVWPARTDTGPWLSRPMRSGLDFGPPERRIGLAAHDFQMRFGTRDLILSYSAKKEGAPTVASRWLQRVTAVLGPEQTEELRQRGERWLGVARRIDDGPRSPRPARASALPPVEARPKALNVTDIETWVRDPYALYARRILRFEPLDPLGRMPDFATRGTVIHDALAEFASDGGPHVGEEGLRRLIAIGERYFAPLRLRPELHALWWPRFLEMARFLVESFEEAKGETTRRIAECKGSLVMAIDAEDFTLNGRADRIDVGLGGEAVIVDFKTGAAPSKKQLVTLMKPQMPLEGFMLREGAFEGLGRMEATALVHVILKGLSGADKIDLFDGEKAKKGEEAKTLADIVGESARQLAGLVRAYRDPERAYPSRPRVLLSRQTGGAYDHLARVAEWQAAGGEGEGEE